MNNEIRNLIKKYEDDKDYTKMPLTEEITELVKKELGVTLPQQYQEYLNEYSHGGIAGVDILGIGLTGRVIFLDVTKSYREEGLPENFVVVENCDEWLYCLNCDTGEIYFWDPFGNVRKEFDSFDEFLLSEYKDAIENL